MSICTTITVATTNHFMLLRVEGLMQGCPDCSEGHLLKLYNMEGHKPVDNYTETFN